MAGSSPGQFAFVTFDSSEGAHPFTIASADRGDRTVTFAIKALGDYTQPLSRAGRGDHVCVEGPYGRFELSRADPGACRSGSPAVLGSRRSSPGWNLFRGAHYRVSADLHYYVRDRESDPFVQRLQALCAVLPLTYAYLHDQQNTPATVDNLTAMTGTPKQAEVWFCGPRGLGETLRVGLYRVWGSRLRFHQEAFEIR